MAERLDELVARQAGVTVGQARALILEARVRVDGTPVNKAGHLVRDGVNVQIARSRRFVSRGGEKLERALDAFSIDPRNRDALDVGASTGGFTDCLLQRGVRSVVAVDVGYGQLDWRLRNDPRVTVRERTNFRLLPDDAFPGGFDLIVSDASFIAVAAIVARAARYLRPGGDIVALVKPQFEAGSARLEAGGVVRDPEVHRAILLEVREAMLSLGLFPMDLVASPLVGPAGNREFLLRVRRDGKPIDAACIERAIAGAP